MANKGPLDAGQGFNMQAGYFGNFAGQGLAGGLGGALGHVQRLDTQQSIEAMQARQLAAQPVLRIENTAPITIRTAGEPVRITFRQGLQAMVDEWLAPVHR